MGVPWDPGDSHPSRGCITVPHLHGPGSRAVFSGTRALQGEQVGTETGLWAGVSLLVDIRLSGWRGREGWALAERRPAPRSPASAPCPLQAQPQQPPHHPHPEVAGGAGPGALPGPPGPLLPGGDAGAPAAAGRAAERPGLLCVHCAVPAPAP